MDITTIIGWVLGLGVLAFGIMYVAPDKEAGTAAQFVIDNLWNFIDFPSIAVVLGGCISGLMVAFPLNIFAKIPRHLKIMFLPTKYRPQDYITQIVDLATEARINGLLSLEGKLNETKDEFLKSSMMLVVDAVEPDKVKQLLETELDYLDERHAQDRAFYDKAGAFGPAFGMIGTLMGLVNLLKQLSDPDAIAPAMALALVTTFYGSCLANMIFIPMSNKLKVRHEEEYLCKMIIAEGVQSIQAGDNPRFIEEKLTNLIPGIMAKKMGGGGGGKEKKGK
ncbi:MAG: motility protein A [Angelakisella sp.]|jgi:chemotaxis protein MotA|nr:motility protein A [Angelakisella sp.]